MALVVIQMGGNIYDNASGGNAIEIWSNSISLLTGEGPNCETILADVFSPIQTWFQAADTRISNTVGLGFIKVNEFDVATGHQINDPTVEAVFVTPPRGSVAASNVPILTTTYKVTLDDSTRSPRARGGFFVPRPQLQCGADGRIDAAMVAAALASADTMLQAINSSSTNPSVGVWSRVSNSVTASNRIRIGNVPDNIRRRKNALTETYTATSLT